MKKIGSMAAWQHGNMDENNGKVATWQCGNMEENKSNIGNVEQ